MSAPQPAPRDRSAGSRGPDRSARRSRRRRASARAARYGANPSAMPAASGMASSTNSGAVRPSRMAERASMYGATVSVLDLSPDLDMTLQEVPDRRLLQDPQPPGPAELVADPQPEAVQRADVECPRTIDIGAAEAEFGCRLVVVRQRRDGARMDAAVADEVTQTLGEHPGLARTGRRDDPGRTRSGGPRPPVGRERGRRWTVHGRPGGAGPFRRSSDAPHRSPRRPGAVAADRRR